MDFGLFEKHETFIKERWLPISVDLMLHRNFAEIAPRALNHREP
jgi:hypothetical protein